MNDLLVILLPVGVLWAAVAMLRMPLALAAVVMLLVNVCFGYAFVFAVPIGGSNWTIDRFVLVLLVAAYVLQRQVGRTERKPLGRAEWLLLALLAWLALSLFTHDFHYVYAATTLYTPPGALPKLTYSATPLWRFATGYGVPALLYWVARQSPAQRGTLGAVHGILALFGLYLAVTGILEVTQQWWLVFPRHIADPAVGIHFGRARGPMVQSVTYGVYLGVCLLCLWARRGMRREASRWILPALLTPLFLAGLFFTYTRSVWIGIALALPCLLLLMAPPRTRLLLSLAALTAGCAVLPGQWENLLGFRREQAAASDTRDSALERVSFAYVSWRMFLDHPAWGVGFGHYPHEKMPYLEDRSVTLPLERIRPLIHHNTYLSLLTETGLPGLALFLALLAAWGGHAWRLYRNARLPPWARGQGVLLLGVLTLYASQYAFHEVSYSTQDNCLLFLLAGMTLGIPAELRRPTRAARDERRAASAGAVVPRPPAGVLHAQLPADDAPADSDKPPG